MTEQGVDYSFARPGGAALAAAGKTFAMRYIASNDGKAVTTKEMDDLHANGLSVGFVFEMGASRALSDRPGGIIDGKRVLAALTALGIPVDRPVYFAVDFNAAPSQFDTIDSYLVGAASTLGSARVGVYGQAKLMDHCAGAKSAAWFWQTYAWSGGVVSKNTHVLQYHNGQNINGAVDLCRSYRADFGQWSGLPDSSTGDTMISPAPTIPAKPQGGTVSIPKGAVATQYRDGSQHTFDTPLVVPAVTVDYGVDKHGYQISLSGEPYLIGPVPFTPTTDCANAVSAEHERTRQEAIKAVEAI